MVLKHNRNRIASKLADPVRIFSDIDIENCLASPREAVKRAVLWFDESSVKFRFLGGTSRKLQLFRIVTALRA